MYRGRRARRARAHGLNEFWSFFAFSLGADAQLRRHGRDLAYFVHDTHRRAVAPLDSSASGDIVFGRA
jgi:hypothetical protein